MTQDEVRELMNKGLITQVINPIDIVNNMETEPEPCDYQLPIASGTTLGGVKIGAGLEIDDDGSLGVKIDYGSGLQMDAGGSIYLDVPHATKTTYGVVKVGEGLNIDNTGELRLWVNSGGGLGTNVDGALEVNIGRGCGLIKNANGSLGVNVGTGLAIGGDQKLYIKDGYGGVSNYVLPIATKDTLGGVRLGTHLSTDFAPIGIDSSTGKIGLNFGTGLSVDMYGRLSASPTNINVSLPIAGEYQLGGVMIGTESGLKIDAEGVLGVKIGNGLEIGTDGELCVTGGGGSDYVLPIAGTDVLGGVKIGTKSTPEAGGLYLDDNDNTLRVKTGVGLSIDDNGGLRANIATSSTQGIVMLGSDSGLTIESNGGLRVNVDYIYQQILTKLKADGHIQ